MNLGAVGKWWTTKELGILRRVYPDGGVAACLPLLPGRTQEAIYQRAQRLQLKTSKPRGERKRWPHSPEKDERIRALYAGTRDPGDVVALARELGVPRWYVSKRATELGLVVPNRAETWSQAELDLLEATSHMLPECARRKFAKAGFKRSASAIKLRRSIDQVKASDNGYHSARQVAQLAAKGLSETEIAVRFGEEPGTVTRLLRLGNVAPEFLEQYRRDEISIDLVIALATTTDHELQRQAFKGAGRYPQPSQIKQLLTKTELSADRDRLAKYVATEYRKAGGGERPDIFSSSGEVYFTEIPLVQRLAKEKLQRRADQLKKDGWAWAEVHLETPNMGKFTHIHGSWSSGKETFTPAQKAHAGCIVQLGWNGKAEVTAGLVRKADVKALNDAVKKERKESGGATAARTAPLPKAPKKRAVGDIPFAALQQLQGLRTAAVRLHLARNPRVAIAALAAALVSDNTDVDACVKAQCKIDWQERPDRRVQDAIESTEAAGQLEQLEEDVLAKVPAGGEPVLEWLLTQPLEVSLSILTMVAAKATVAADKLRHNPDDPGSRFAGLVGLDFADVWQPNAEWLGSVPRNVVLDAVEETCGKKEAKALDRLRKGDFATRAEQLLQGKRWIPRQMRSPAPKPARTKKPKSQKGQMAAAGDVPVAPAL